MKTDSISLCFKMKKCYSEARFGYKGTVLYLPTGCETNFKK